MTTKYITDAFKLHNAKQFIESFSEPNGNVYYSFLGNNFPYANDAAPPPDVSTTNYDITYDTWDVMTSGKRITTSDITHMVRKVDWTSGIVYTPYSQDDPLLNTKNFFVASPESGSYHIFICLGNNSGSAALNPPLFSQTAAASESYYTNDGYQWKFLYTISGTTWNDFATTDFMPVIQDSTVKTSAVSGAIDSIRVNFPGKNYRSHAEAKFSVIAVSNDDTIYEIQDTISSTDKLSIDVDFYKNNAVYVETAGTKQLRTIIDYTITTLGVKRIIIDTAFSPLPSVGDKLYITPLVTLTGDGTAALGRAIIDPSTDKVDRIEVINRGKNYTYATAIVQGNTGLVSDPIANTAALTVIIGPIGGHGHDTLEELGSHHVGIKTTFVNSEGGHISATNDFREIGLLKDPLMHNVSMNITHRSVVVDIATVSNFIFGSTSNSYATVISVPTANSTQTLIVDKVFGLFQTGEFIYQGTTLSSAQTAAANDPDKVTGSTRLATINTLTHTAINNGVFDQRHVYNVNYVSGNVLKQDEQVWQDKGLATEGSAFVHELSGNNLYVVKQKGFIVSSNIGTGTNRYILGEPSNPTPKYKIIDHTDPEMIYGSGSVLYKENVSPVTRSLTQKELFKFVIEF